MSDVFVLNNNTIFARIKTDIVDNFDERLTGRTDEHGRCVSECNVLVSLSLSLCPCVVHFLYTLTADKRQSFTNVGMACEKMFE